MHVCPGGTGPPQGGEEWGAAGRGAAALRGKRAAVLATAGNQENGPGQEGPFVLIILNGPERQIFPGSFVRRSFLKRVSGSLNPQNAGALLKSPCITQTPAGPTLDNNPISTRRRRSRTPEIGLFALLTCGASQPGNRQQPGGSPRRLIRKSSLFQKLRKNCGEAARRGHTPFIFSN